MSEGGMDGKDGKERATKCCGSSCTKRERYQDRCSKLKEEVMQACFSFFAESQIYVAQLLTITA